MFDWVTKLFKDFVAFWKTNWKRIFKEFVIFYSAYLLLTALISAGFGFNFWNVALVLVNIWCLFLIIKK